jgi:thymidylate synthase
MRFFMNCGEAIDEIKRDLAEMGTEVHPQTMQDKYVGDNPDYKTKELQDYCYTIFSPIQSLDGLHPTQPWADAEFIERTSGEPLNPGVAYLLRDDVWKEFLHNGKFGYTYAERMSFQLGSLIEELKKHPESRQIYLSIWDPVLDVPHLGGVSRVPCSLGYLFQIRKGQLHIKYLMRSCDFATHMQNDIYLACRLMEYVAQQVGVEPGNFTHFVGSLHVYAKDVQGVF